VLFEKRFSPFAMIVWHFVNFITPSVIQPFLGIRLFLTQLLQNPSQLAISQGIILFSHVVSTTSLTITITIKTKCYEQREN
jgi:hypothetical protein